MEVERPLSEPVRFLLPSPARPLLRSCVSRLTPCRRANESNQRLRGQAGNRRQTIRGALQFETFRQRLTESAHHIGADRRNIFVQWPQENIVCNSGGFQSRSGGSRHVLGSEEHTSELQSLRHLVCR